MINTPTKNLSRKVFFLGAGASVDAGYPLTKHLFDTLKAKHECTLDATYQAAWEVFNQAINAIRINYPAFSDCSDIEYLMTILSLTQKFYENLTIPPSISDTKDRFDKKMDSFAKAFKYEYIKNKFAICIDLLFAYLNYYMVEDNFTYLKKLLSNELEDGDTIITTNYDLLAERCLRSLNLWNIQDGYGFPVTLINAQGTVSSQMSKIKILKLHGSTGWLNSNEEIIIDTNNMQHLISRCGKDEKYSPDIEKSYLILPDFLKPLSNSIMIDIWSQAQQALLSANEVHIIGFSLPEYDVNIRTLLLPLRQRLTKGECQVNIYILNTDKGSENRWINLLTNKIKIIKYDTLKDYCERFA